jgi:hypothetical protein
MERNKVCKCDQCGQTFEAVRYNAQYCSAKCRKRRQRELERIDEYKAKAFYALERLAKYSNRTGHDKALAAVLSIMKRAQNCADYGF